MGTVDVERYTGSCLISTVVRGKAKTKPSDIYAPNKINRVMRINDEIQPPNSQSLASDPRNLAGAPLVSIAASIRRGGAKHKNNQRPNTKDHQQLWRPALVLPPSVYLRNADTQNLGQRSPHSLQGAPLIRLPRVNKGPTGPKNGPPMTIVPNPTRPVRTNDVESIDGSSSCISSDCSSVTSDEGLASGGSDSSLPRLIKPRKRRKKERKIAFVHKLEHQNVADVTANPESETELLANEAITRLLQLNLDSPPESETPPPLTGFQQDPYRMGASQMQSWGMPGLYTSDHSWNSVWGSPDMTSASPWSNEAFPIRSSSSCWPKSITDKFVPETRDTMTRTEVREAGSLEVSSEIITSPYGHRDIEIRFFSSLRNSASPGEDRG